MPTNIRCSITQNTYTTREGGERRGGGQGRETEGRGGEGRRGEGRGGEGREEGGQGRDKMTPGSHLRGVGWGICPSLLSSHASLGIHQALCQLMLHKSLRTVGFQDRPLIFWNLSFALLETFP